MLLEVEVQSESEADEAIDAGADIIMLDNMEGEQLVAVASRLKEKWKGKRKFKLESSGNVTEDNLKERAINGMDTSCFSSSACQTFSRNRHTEHKLCPPICTSR